MTAEKAKDGRLRAGFGKHRRETENQVKRLEIAGERYTRTIKRQPGLLDVKSSHWDNRGKILR